MSLLKHPAIFARLSLMNNCKKFKRGSGTKQKAETSSKDELDLLGEGDGDSFTGSNADLESAADNLFTSPPRPQPLAFSSLSLKTPAKAVPPTPGTVLQNKIQRNLEKSLGDSLNIHIQQQMGSFQASMLEAFQSLREELAVKKPAEVDPSPHASKAGPSSKSAANLDLPPPRSSTNAQSEAMDVDVGPALPPRLVLNQTSSDQYVAPSEAIPKDSSYSHKKQSHRQTVAENNRALPRINWMRIPTNLGSILDLRNTLTRASINLGPDMCHLQKKITPLWPDTGLLSPLGLSPQAQLLIKTSHNMIQTPLIIGK